MYYFVKELAVFCPFFISAQAFVCLFIMNYKKDEAKLTLSYFMLLGAIFYGINIFKEYGNKEVYNYFYTIYIGILLVGIPLIYIYIRSLTLLKTFDKFLLLHFVPAFILLDIGSILFFILNFQERIDFISNHKINENLYLHFLYLFINSFKFIFIAQLVFYYFKIKNILNEHEKVINHVFSDSSGYDLNWVRLLFKILFVWGIIGMIGLYYLINQFPGYHSLSLIIDITIGFLFGILHIMASMQKRIPNCNNDLDIEKDELNYISSHKLKQKLVHCFEVNKIYLQKDLTIWEVCRGTNSNRTYISNLINEEFKVNFNTFVNQYRVDYASKILQDFDYQHKSLDEIASLCGFNSLASFNRVFKKFTNNYPGCYRSKMIETPVLE